ncbi:MAG: hypothetical protein EOM23_10440 [Candidatus Moranbacteria bacterium]|nr:hypothetical protein [Candidatus Moranbacteria bacterium]
MSKDAVSELEASNTLYTDDTETLTQVRNIIVGVKYLIDTGKVGEGIITPLIRAGVVDSFIGDGLQPARNLFKTQ